MHIYTEVLTRELAGFKDDCALSKLYQWPIDAAIGELEKIDPEICACINQADNTFHKTLELRDRLESALTKKSAKTGAYEYWIIHDWGKIRTGKEDSDQEKFLEDVEQNQNDKLKFERIASWSKCLAFKYPREYAIYDARVIYSLNWLLLKAKAEHYFPAPKGRNSLMNALDYTMLLLAQKKGFETVAKEIKSDILWREENPSAKSQAVKKLKKGLFIEPRNAYAEYCNLLKNIAKQLYDESDKHALTKVEMILFSIADKNIVSDVLSSFKKVQLI